MEEIIAVLDRLVANFKINVEKDKELINQIPHPAPGFIRKDLTKEFLVIIKEYDEAKDKSKVAEDIISKGIYHCKKMGAFSPIYFSLVSCFIRKGDFLNKEEIVEDGETLYQIIQTLANSDD